MSPDPPREDSGDDDNRIRRFSGEFQFIDGIMDDEEFFIIPDAPYELDMEDESEYSDSDEELGAGDPGAGVLAGGVGVLNNISTAGSLGEDTTTEGQEGIVLGQGRGRYRLLIPFPVDSNSTNASSDEATAPETGSTTNHSTTTSTNRNRQDVQSSGTDPIVPGSQHNAPEPSSSTSSKKESSSTAEEKREIELTEEKVETIMQVMKNIKLPPNSIPKWAAEVDEDAWRKKLSDSIGSNKCQKNDVKEDKGSSSASKNSK